MSKQLTIEDVNIKEVVIGRDENGDYAMNVLYSIVDTDGNEYSRGWKPMKGGDVITQSVITRIEKVIEVTALRAKIKEGLNS